MALKSKLTREQLQTLAQLDDAARIDLLSLFDEAHEASTKLDEMQNNIPTDSQAIVDSDEYKTQKAAREDAETKLAALQAKLDDLDIRPASGILTMFEPICSLFGHGK